MKLTKQDKIDMLVDAIQISNNIGYDISLFVGKPLSYFDFQKVYDRIIERIEESKECGYNDINIEESNYYKHFNK